MQEKDLTKEYLEHLFDYDLEQGKLYWKNPKVNKVKPGDEAGWVDNYGYPKVSINNKAFRIHRILFFLANNWWPKEIDHINRNTSDNRINSLVASDRTHNNKNRKLASNNSSGVTGVNWLKHRKKWRAEFRYKNIHKSKVFEKIEDCIAWRNEYLKKYNFNPTHGLEI